MIEARQSERWMKTTISKIEGMNCDGCADTIQDLIEKEPGYAKHRCHLPNARRDCSTIRKPFRMLIQRPGFRVVARQATDEDAS